MQLHQLKPIHKGKKRKQVGRGGAHGHYACSGVAKRGRTRGGKLKPVIRELIKKYPKLKGYKFKSIFDKPAVFNLDILEKNFDSGAVVSPITLKEKRILRAVDGRIPKVKILGGGELKKNLIFENCSVSKTAEEKIKKAGGEIKQKIKK
jgi:large subunit ribosomal protein L15